MKTARSAALVSAFSVMRSTMLSLFLLLSVPARAGNGSDSPRDTDALREAVKGVEHGFAETMARRNLDKFSEFVSEEAVFFSGDRVLRGKAAVVDDWKDLFKDPVAPFSWEPETVEVLASGNLALSSGPVYDPNHKLVARFTSIWRLDSDGRWRIIFDKGNKVCP